MRRRRQCRNGVELLENVGVGVEPELGKRRIAEVRLDQNLDLVEIEARAADESDLVNLAVLEVLVACLGKRPGQGDHDVDLDPSALPVAAWACERVDRPERTEMVVVEDLPVDPPTGCVALARDDRHSLDAAPEVQANDGVTGFVVRDLPHALAAQLVPALAHLALPSTALDRL